MKNSSNLLSFGSWLKQRRKALDMTQEILANHLNCSVVTIRKIEADSLRPSRQLLDLLLAGLEVPYSERAELVQHARHQELKPLEKEQQSAQSPLADSKKQPKILLPASLSNFIGREKTLDELITKIQRAEVRLLTLWGAPGIGKTRLALQMASKVSQDFADGVFFIDLTPARDQPAMLNIIIQNLKIQRNSSETLLETISAYLSSKHALLILDNFEQVAEAASVLTELLSAGNSLKIVVTSRIILKLRGEWQFEIGPLQLPAKTKSVALNLSALSQTEAVALFVQRCREVKPHFQLNPENSEAVLDICRYLEGIPLALELAAAHIRIFTPTELLFHLRQQTQTKFLADVKLDLPAHQRSLSAAIEWSYQLLTSTEKYDLNCLAVFLDGWDFEAAQIITNQPNQRHTLDLLVNLISKSLVIAGETSFSTTRYRMLTSIREYSLTQLQATEQYSSVVSSYINYYLDRVKKSAEQLTGSEMPQALDWLNSEYANLHQALELSIEQNLTRPVIEFCQALFRYWEIQDYISIGFGFVCRALNLTALTDHERSILLNIAGCFAHDLADYPAAQSYHKQALAIRRSADNQKAIAASLNNLGTVAFSQGAYDEAYDYYSESFSIIEKFGNKFQLAIVICNLGRAVEGQGKFQLAEEYYRKSLALARELENLAAVSSMLLNLGAVNVRQGIYQPALKYVQESLVIKQKIGDTYGIAEGLAVLISILDSLAETNSLQVSLLEVATLCGAVGGLLKSLNSSLVQPYLLLYNTSREHIQALTASIFNDAYSKGFELTSDEAVDTALKIISLHELSGL